MSPDVAGPSAERRRILLAAWSELGSAEPTFWASVPGRTELSGNHTDHQGGKVLAAAVDRDVVAYARPRTDGRIRIRSLGHGDLEVSTADLSPRDDDRETTVSLVRGACDGLARRGLPMAGFDAVVHGEVGAGEGLSSSAAFTVLVAYLAVEAAARLSDNGRELSQGLSPIVAAQVAQFAEQVHFGKPCGLMDQLACAVGGAALLDFRHPENPRVEPVPLDLGHLGYSLVLIDTGSKHHDLTADYAAVPAEMGRVAHLLGAQRLVDVEAAALGRRWAELRPQVGDRALLRAMHFFAEMARVEAQAEALERGEWRRFLALMSDSGLSSWTWLQNVVPAGADPGKQSVALALAVTQHCLGRLQAETPELPSACRVHGGGFAGRIQVLLPSHQVPVLRRELAPLFGADAALETTIRAHGAVCGPLSGAPA